MDIIRLALLYLEKTNFSEVNISAEFVQQRERDEEKDKLVPVAEKRDNLTIWQGKKLRVDKVVVKAGGGGALDKDYPKRATGGQVREGKKSKIRVPGPE